MLNKLLSCNIFFHSYYTDRHDTPLNKIERHSRYIPKKYELSLREPVWAGYKFDPEQVSLQTALADARLRMKIESNDQLVYKDVLDEHNLPIR